MLIWAAEANVGNSNMVAPECPRWGCKGPQMVAPRARNPEFTEVEVEVQRARFLIHAISSYLD